jgi:hypothetical protein
VQQKQRDEARRQNARLQEQRIHDRRNPFSTSKEAKSERFKNLKNTGGTETARIIRHLRPPTNTLFT